MEEQKIRVYLLSWANTYRDGLHLHSDFVCKVGSYASCLISEWPYKADGAGIIILIF